MNTFIEEDPFDPNRPIPQSYRIASSGQHFYRYGFSQYQNGYTSRSNLNHPLLTFVVPVVMNIRCIYFAFTPKQSPDFHLLFGEFGSFMGLQFHINVTISLTFWITHISQVIHFYGYLRGRGEPYMKLFDMMSGRLASNSLGLNDEAIIKDILVKTKIAFFLSNLIQYSGTLITMVVPLMAFMLENTSLKYVAIGLVHAMGFGLTYYYVFNVTMNQIFYYIIICYYLKLKQREVNNNLRKIIENKERIKIFDSKFSQIYEKINEYDSNYWSKFVAITWICFSCLVSTVIFLFIFEESSIIIKYMLGYAAVVLASIQLLIIHMSSSVNYESKKTYKLLASYKTVCMRTMKQPLIANTRHGIKVFDVFSHYF